MRSTSHSSHNPFADPANREFARDYSFDVNLNVIPALSINSVISLRFLCVITEQWLLLFAAHQTVTET
jgi:hypothetical protein